MCLLEYGCFIVVFLFTFFFFSVFYSCCRHTSCVVLSPLWWSLVVLVALSGVAVVHVSRSAWKNIDLSHDSTIGRGSAKQASKTIRGCRSAPAEREKHFYGAVTFGSIPSTNHKSLIPGLMNPRHVITNTGFATFHRAISAKLEKSVRSSCKILQMRLAAECSRVFAHCWPAGFNGSWNFVDTHSLTANDWQQKSSRSSQIFSNPVCNLHRHQCWSKDPYLHSDSSILYGYEKR